MPMPGELTRLFATPVYRAALDGAWSPALAVACRSIAEDDTAGQRWCEKNGYLGYTSYASLNDLPWRFPEFKRLAKALEPHARAFAKELGFDLAGKPLSLDSLWINILPTGAGHSGHIHPHSVISGTYYVVMPAGTSALRFEDPRLPLMMAAPARKKKAPQDLQPFVSMPARPGDLLLWESWLRHEVPPNLANEDRISVSVNYRWG